MQNAFARLALLLLPSWWLCQAQNPLQGIFSATNLAKAKVTGVKYAPGSQPDTVVLKFAASDRPVGLIVPVPPAGSDWTKFGSVVFRFESDSTFHWNFQVINRKGEVSETRVYPFAGVEAKVPIATRYFVRDYLQDYPLKGCKLFNWEEHIDVTQVASLGITMVANREVTLKLGPIALIQGEVPDEVSVSKPVVDAFGQWIPQEWPGKVHSPEELKRAWERDDQELAKADTLGFCTYGGWQQHKESATGFFHTAQVDGRWWLVDPEGHLFFSIGSNGVRPGDSSTYKGREKLFEKVPPGTGDMVDFAGANLEMRYGRTDFAAKWMSKTIDRMRAWGFNTINGSFRGPADVASQKNPLPFVTFARIGSSTKNWVGFPDVYSEEFVRSAGQRALEQCAPLRDNRYLIGYFMGNEPHWLTRGLLEHLLADPEPSATQSFARRFLKDKGDTPASREALLEALARRYFQTVKDTLHKADPNHLLLGIRYDNSILGEVDPATVARYHLHVGIHPTTSMEPIIRASDVFDVFSINIYAYAPPGEKIIEIANLVKRPIMFTEGSVSTEARGYTPGVIEVKDQTERGVGYQYYIEQAASIPAVVGSHYWEWASQPVTGSGRSGETFNMGFVDIVDLPYREQVTFAKTAHTRLYAVHAGEIAPSARAPKFR